MAGDEGEEKKAEKASSEKPEEDTKKVQERLESKMQEALGKPDKGAGDDKATGDPAKPPEGGGEKKPAGKDSPGGGDAGSPGNPSGEDKAEDKKDDAAAAGSPGEKPAEPAKEAPSEKDKGDDAGGKKEGERSEGAKKEDEPEDAKKSEPKKEEKKDAPKESLKQLVTQKEEIDALLASIEDSYRDATLPDSAYHEVKEKNEKKLEEINAKIAELEKTASPEELKALKTDAAAEPSKTAAPTEPSPQPKPSQEAAPGAAGKEPLPSAKEAGKAETLIKLLEQKIEERLKDVITSASVEVTDKRLKKMETKVDSLEMTTKGKLETMGSELKHLQGTAESVGKYDKQFTMMNTEIEKVKALVDSVKEAKNLMDEKMQRVTESFAEIRSIVYQREASSKEESVMLDKLKDTIAQVDTAKILREFTTRDEQMRDVNTRLERLERSGKMLTDTMNRIKGLMTDMGSLENVIKASKHVGEKLEKIQEIEERLKARSSKLDSVYVDMKKRLDEFAEYKVKQDKLAGVGDDLMKNVEELTRRLSDYATKADVTSVRDELKIVKETAKSAASAPAAQAQTPAKAAENPEIAKLKGEKEEIETLISTLEENFKSKAMDEADYNSAKEKNMQKLVQIEKKIKQLQSAPASRAGGEGREEGDEGKHSRVMLLAKLRESYENGELSRRAYEKSRRMLLGK